MLSLDQIDTVSTSYKKQSSNESLPITKMIEEQKFEDTSTVASSVKETGIISIKLSQFECGSEMTNSDDS